MSPRIDTDVVVIGGGVAGLVAARTLIQAGLTCALLEASHRWGGVVRTEHDAGFLLEAGPDSILAQKPEGVALCKELGLSDRLLPTNREQRTVYVLRHGRLHAMPEGTVLGIPTRPWSLIYSGLFSWRGKLRMALEPFVPRRRETSEESIAEFFRRRLGEEALEVVGDPLLGGIHAGDPERLSMRATFPRLLDMEQKYGSLVRGMQAAPKGGGGAAFLSLRGGMSELVKALVDSLPSTALHLGATATGIEQEGPALVVTTSGSAWRARGVIVAVPAYRAAPLLERLVPEAGQPLRGIPFASTATVLLGFRQPDVAHPLDGYGYMVPRSEGRRTKACAFVSTKLEGRAPAGHVLIRGFLGSARDQTVLESDDATLVRCVLEEASAVLGIHGAPVVSRVFRYPLSTPQMDVGHSDRVAAVEKAVGSVPGLSLTGGGLRGTGLPDVIADATRTAKVTLSQLATTP